MSRVALVIETDIFADVDDVGALAVAHALADLGLADVLAVGVNTPSRWGAHAVQAVADFYGRGNIPIGVLHPQDDTVAPREYARRLAQTFAPRLAEPLPTAVDLLRDTFDAAEPSSITLVSIGFHHNLVALLDSPGGISSVRRAVGRTVVMAGLFPAGAEFNLTEHPDMAGRFINEWPTEIEFLGFEVGEHVITGEGIEWPLAERNPVADAYEHFNGAGAGRPSWDPLTIDLAVRGTDGVYEVSEPGRIEIDDRAHIRWRAEHGGPHRYVRALVDHATLARRIDALLEATPVARR